MATSGSTNFTLTRNEIVEHALNLLNIPGIGMTPSNEDMAFGYKCLNLLVKSWQAEGCHLWATEEAYLFLEEDTHEYALSDASTSAHYCLKSDAIIATLASAGAAAATSLTVDSTTGMTAADTCGVVLDDGSMHWTTISSITNSTTLVLSVVLPSATSASNKVFTYTSRAPRPLRILYATRLVGTESDPTETKLMNYGQEQYVYLPNKKTAGVPTAYYYAPFLTTGKFHVWPVSSDLNIYIKLFMERSLEDFDSANENADFPQEWLRPLTYNLAVDMAPAYGITDTRFDKLVALAAAYKQSALQFDTEEGVIQIT